MRLVPTIGLDEARLAAEAALVEARRRSLAVSACVADASGIPLALLRDDDARSTTVEMALNKAWTAAAHRRATADLAKVAQPGAPGFGVNQQHGGRFSILPGGVPVAVDDVVIGSVGVSGGDADGDIAAAEAGCAAIGAALLKPSPGS